VSRRTRVTLAAVYAAALLLPFAWITLHSGGDLQRWFDTGVCPAGPMDRPARPCSLFELLVIVFLGGSVAFMVIPALALWWALVTGIAQLVWRRIRKAQASRGVSGSA